MKKKPHECEGTSCICLKCQNDVKNCCGNKKHVDNPCPIRKCDDFVAVETEV